MARWLKQRIHFEGIYGDAPKYVCDFPLRERVKRATSLGIFQSLMNKFLSLLFKIYNNFIISFGVKGFILQSL